MRRWLSALLIVVLLTGCGFHLRGSSSAVQLSAVLPAVAIVGADTEIGFGARLRRALLASGVEVLPQPSPDRAVLEVGEVEEKRRVLSVDRDVRAREYALISEVRFRLLPDPEAETRWHRVQTRRDLVVDPFQVLGTEQEEKRMRSEMEEDLVQRMILVLREQARS